MTSLISANAERDSKVCLVGFFEEKNGKVSGIMESCYLTAFKSIKLPKIESRLTVCSVLPVLTSCTGDRIIDRLEREILRQKKIN